MISLFSKNTLISLELSSSNIDFWISEKLELFPDGRILRHKTKSSISKSKDIHGEIKISLWPESDPINNPLITKGRDYFNVTDMDRITRIYLPKKEEVELFYEYSGKTPPEKA